MQESTEPSLAKPVDSEAQCDPANRADSESGSSVPQSVVPATFVEISPIPRLNSHDEKAEKEEETARETDDQASSPGEEHMTGEGTHRGQAQKTAKEEPPPSEITLAAARKAFARGDLQEASDLVYKFARQSTSEEQAKKLAQAPASESSDYQEDDEEPTEEEHEIQIAQFAVSISGRPANAAGLTMEDLIRRDDVIEAVHYVGVEDGIINQFSSPFELPWDLRSLYEPLYECLILPAGVEGFRTTRELFNDISALLHKHVMLPSNDCSLLAYWAIATWFTDYLPFLPSVIISGPASTADLLLRTLLAVCRRPVLLGELSPAILRKLPIHEITPTLLIREPQLSRYMLALLKRIEPTRVFVL